MSAVVSAGHLAPPPADPWAFWQASLAGKPQPVSPTRPQFGFYRFRLYQRDRGEPCQMWYERDQWWAVVGGQHRDDIELVWRRAHANPISADLYQAVLDGGVWPDEIASQSAAPTIGHNAGLPEEIARDEIAEAERAFLIWLAGIGGAVATEEQDQIAKGYDERIRKLRQGVEAARKAEKDEYLRKGQAIDAKWQPVKVAALAVEDKISAAVTPYRVERKRLADEAARIEREQREARRREAEAVAAAAIAKGEEPPPVPIDMTARTPRKATGLRKVETVVIDDLPALAAFLCALSDPPPDLVEACRSAAGRILRAKGKVPGAHLDISDKA